MTNKNRGEISINLSGREFILHTNFQILCKIEASLNKSIIAIISGLSSNNLTMMEMATIITHSIKEVDSQPLTTDEIGSMILQTGTVNILPDLIKFLERSVGFQI